ncbi:MAG TPA: FAD binding domain-containing protein [Candidatus Limnocylindrales bacterium]|nr:FAD binding domain-containing protein [Candidatus Limnocylindrales bacterium]
MKPAPFEYTAARSAAEAVAALGRAGEEAKVLAGGQSLVPMLNMRLARPSLLVDINGARELDYIREADGAVRIGATTRQRAFERWAASRLPLAAEALSRVGHAAIRNRGTVVGSLVHADPASELPAVLLCLDGSVVARSEKGERVVPAGDLYLAPLTTALQPGELAVEARLTLPPAGAGWGVAEVARRHGDFALVGAAAVVSIDASGRVSRARVGFFGVGGTPARGSAAESALTGQTPTPALITDAARAAAAALRPDGDIHATADYRRRVAAVLAERTLTAAVARCGRAA